MQDADWGLLYPSRGGESREVTVWRLAILVVVALLIHPSKAHAACTGSSPSWTCTTWADFERLVEGSSIKDDDVVTLAAGTYVANTQALFTKGITIKGAAHCTYDGGLVR